MEVRAWVEPLTSTSGGCIPYKGSRDELESRGKNVKAIIEKSELKTCKFKGNKITTWINRYIIKVKYIKSIVSYKERDIYLTILIFEQL